MKERTNAEREEMIQMRGQVTGIVKPECRHSGRRKAMAGEKDRCRHRFRIVLFAVLIIDYQKEGLSLHRKRSLYAGLEPCSGGASEFAGD